MRGRKHMRALNLYTEDESGAVPQKKKRSRSPKVIVGLCVLLAIPVVGTTFASTVTINSGNPVVFGQGASSALACDPAVIITPGAAFINGVWKLQTITIGNINTTNTSDNSDNSTGCMGKTISVSAYDGSSNIISASTVTFTVPSTSPYTATSTSSNAATIALTKGNTQPDTITITLTTPVDLGLHNVSGFTIQQS